MKRNHTTYTINEIVAMMVMVNKYLDPEKFPDPEHKALLYKIQADIENPPRYIRIDQ